MKTLAVIPARAGSTRIKDKNLQKIDGLTLVQHAANAALGRVDDLVVSTDDPRIAAGLPCVLRPRALSGPTADIKDAVRHALDEMETKTGNYYDQVVTLQPTLPLRPPGLLGEILRQKALEGTASALTLLPAVPWTWQISPDGTATTNFNPSSYPRSQDVEYTVAGELNSITVSDRDIVLARRRWALPLLVCYLPEWVNIDIDTEEDLEAARDAWPYLSTKPLGELRTTVVERLREI